MRNRQYERLEKRILDLGSNSIELRWEWGRLVLHDEKYTQPDGRLKGGAIDRLIAEAQRRGLKLSRAEVQRRLQCARTYPTKAQIASVRMQFDDWWTLRQAGFPPVEVAEDGVLFDATGEPTQSQDEPYDPRPPSEQRDAAVSQLKRILDTPEANGQDPLPNMPGLRIFIPGFTPDTTGPETTYRIAFQLHEKIKAANAQIHNASDKLKREDQEREEKLYRGFNATGRNLDATLRDGENALLGADSPVAQ